MQHAMSQQPDRLPQPLKWLMIALITLALACALAAPAPDIDWSKDESLSGTVVLQKKVYDDDGKVVDTDHHFDAVLADSVHNPTALKAILSASHHLTQTVPLHFNSAAPRAPPALLI